MTAEEFKKILGNSKKVMKAANELNPEKIAKSAGTGFVDDEPVYEAQVPRAITEDQIRNSKLPAAIKQAMIDNPIQQPTFGGNSFSAEDMMEDKPIPEYNYKPKPRTVVNENRTVQTPQPVQQRQTNSDLITISKADLSSLINQKIIEALKTDRDKQLVEDTIKRTILSLKKEGKLLK
jgi:hypothetical protein